MTLSLGYSNPVEYTVPEGVTVEAPSQTELLVKSSDKQKLGQVLPKFERFGRQSLTKARVSGSLMNTWLEKKPRKNR